MQQIIVQQCYSWKRDKTYPEKDKSSHSESKAQGARKSEKTYSNFETGNLALQIVLLLETTDLLKLKGNLLMPNQDGALHYTIKVQGTRIKFVKWGTYQNSIGTADSGTIFQTQSAPKKDFDKAPSSINPISLRNTHEYKLLQWPPQSFDLNPVEHLWMRMKDHYYAWKRHQPI